jgi:YD repeat-containing protein
MSKSAVYQYDSLGRLIGICFSDGKSIGFAYDKMGNRTTTTVTACCNKFTIYEKNSSFTASDGQGSYYRISGTAINVVMPTSPADGSVYKFKVLSGTSTFAFDGNETINHANGVSDQNLVLASNSGVLELIAVTGGWDET